MLGNERLLKRLKVAIVNCLVGSPSQPSINRRAILSEAASLDLGDGEVAQWLQSTYHGLQPLELFLQFEPGSYLTRMQTLLADGSQPPSHLHLIGPPLPSWAAQKSI